MSGTNQGWAVNMIRLQLRRIKTRERRVPVSSYPIPSCLCPCYVSCPITRVSVLCALFHHTCVCAVYPVSSHMCLCCVSCSTTRVCAVCPVPPHVCLYYLSCAITRVSMLCILCYHMCVCAVCPVPSYVCLCCVSYPTTCMSVLCILSHHTSAHSMYGWLHVEEIQISLEQGSNQ